MENKERQIKVVLLGAIGAGKSSILKRYVEKDFHENEPTSMGTGFLTKKLNYKNENYRFQIWDTAGQEKYAPLAVMYYRDAEVILLIYDIASKDSFIQLKDWYKEVKEKGPKDVAIVIVGNKIDLNAKAQVAQDEVREFAESISARFKLTSAKDNVGIDDLFNNLIDELDDTTSYSIGRKGSKLNFDITYESNKERPDKSMDRSSCC